MDEFELIFFYFNIEMNYDDILQSCAVRHGVLLSKRHLIQLLKMHGLKYADLGEVIDFIFLQLEGPGRLHEYRWMYKCLKKWHSCKKGRCSFDYCNSGP